MGKKKYVIPVIVFLSVVYAYTSSISISEKSENGMWKYTYKMNLDASEPTGWQGKIKQLDKQEVCNCLAIILEFQLLVVTWKKDGIFHMDTIDLK